MDHGDAKRMVAIGTIVAAHGVRGAVRIRSFTEAPEDVAAYGPVTDGAGRRRRLRAVGAVRGLVIATIDGVADRDAAEALVGQTLSVPRDVLPPPGEDAFYVADLVGLAATTMDGAPLGRVRLVEDHGAGWVIEIDRPGAAPVLVPFTRAVVPVVDLAAGRIAIDPPEGLLDPPRGTPGGRRPDGEEGAP